MSGQDTDWYLKCAVKPGGPSREGKGPSCSGRVASALVGMQARKGPAPWPGTALAARLTEPSQQSCERGDWASFHRLQAQIQKG